MTTFDKQSIPGQTFLYQRGIVTTTKPWGRPTYQKLKNYLTYINQHTEVFSNYEVYLNGGVLYSFDTTWDVDMLLIGGTQTDSKIEEDLNYLTNLSLNTFNMLADISWFESRPQDLTYSGMVESDFTPDNIIHKKIGYVKKQIGENIEEKDLRTFEDATILTEHLIQRNYGATTKYTQKMRDKVQNNPNPVTIVTFSASEFLSTDEDYFTSNTNR